MTEAGGLRMPADVMGAVALDQLVVHGWDLAGATGQSFTCDPGQHGSRPCFHRRVCAAARDGLFGPVADDPRMRPTFDRALE